MTNTLFDAYLFIDWSGNSTPKTGKDSIWYCYAQHHDTGLATEAPKNPSTRHQAFEEVHNILIRCLRKELRVLVGFDFPYGYAAGLNRAMSGAYEAPWRNTWMMLADRIQDDHRNRSNRWKVADSINHDCGGGPGPFWGHPHGKNHHYTYLTSKRNGLFQYPLQVYNGEHLNRLRICEQRASGVQEAWKLFGIGSVGSQALLGIPRVCELRFSASLVSRSKVWPFETGFTATPSPDTGPYILHAEIWPGLVDAQVKKMQQRGRTDVRDALQVEAMCHWAGAEDLAGTLGQWFDRPGNLDAEELNAVVGEEGWILGYR